MYSHLTGARMSSFEELLNKKRNSVNSNQIKELLLQKIRSTNDRYAIYSFFFPFGSHLRADYPSFIPFYENLQHSNSYYLSNDEVNVHNLIIDMVSQYEKGDDRLYSLLMVFFEKF